jgi:O-antigen ligase
MITFKMISIIISVFLLIEVLYSFVPFLSFIFENDPSVYRQFSSIYQENFFIGFSGNKNITAASIAIKIPFLFYLFNITNKKIFLILSSFFSFAVFSLIFLLKARSVFLSFSFVLFSFIITSLYFKRYRSFLFLPLIVLSFLFVSLLTTKQYNPVLNDIKSINFSAASSSDRFLLWDNAFSYILDHPIIGCGIGNWKIESLPYWNTHLSNYVVPYHAHNDFLEFTTELGLVGGFTYTFFFFSIFISLFSLLYRFRNHFIRFNQIFVVFASFSVYTIDALLNFPHERPRIQIIFAILVSLVLLLNKRKKFA